jgi:protein-tyrosine phosphatase
MAAELFAACARDRRYRLRVASAGIAASSGHPPPAPVIEVMAGRGFDLSSHRAQQLTGLLASRHELILVMERGQQHFIEHHWSELKGRVYRVGAWRNWDIADPFGRSVDSYLDCLACLETCVADWAPRLMSRLPRHWTTQRPRL